MAQITSEPLETALDSPPPKRTRASVALYVALVVFTAVSAMHNRGFVFDDPFIFFRYARNLALGHGWVYNIGHPGFNGATSPLYVLVLSLAYRVDSNLVAVSGLIFVATLSACACCTHAALAKVGHWWAGAAAAGLIVSSPWLFISRGMETTLFLFLFAVSILLMVARRPYGLGVALALTVLTRPDGIVMVLAVLATLWIIDRRVPWRTVASGALVALLWLMYAEIVVGSIIPATLAAKMAQGRSGLFNGGFWLGPWVVPRTYHFALVELTVGLVSVVGLWALTRHATVRRVVVPIVVSGIVLYLAYCVLNVPRYTWYFAPLVYAVTVLAGLGFETLAQYATRAWSHWWSLIVVVVVAALMVAGVVATPSGPPRPGYIAAAQWLTSHTSTHATVASAEIGILGWYSNRPMVDYDGLLNSRVIASLSRGDETWWINHLKPNYWMVRRPPFLEDRQVLNAPWFHHVFRAVYSNSHVTIFRRIGLVPSGPLRLSHTHIGDARRGRYYYRTVTALGGTGPYDWTVSSGDLPPGLHLVAPLVDFTTARLEGTPTQSGLFHFTIRVTSYGVSLSSGVVHAYILRVRR